MVRKVYAPLVTDSRTGFSLSKVDRLLRKRIWDPLQDEAVYWEVVYGTGRCL
jgi:hypothetical protein